MHRLSTFIAAVVLATGLSIPGDAHAQGACDIRAATQQASNAAGLALLCVNNGDVSALKLVTQLVPNGAYTVWFVYFDDPSKCQSPGNCGAPDFAGANPQAVLGRMDSGVAPANGVLLFSGRIAGLQPSSGSQLWLWLFGHGPVDSLDGRHRARQLLTPEDPGAGAPHLGNVVDGPLGFPAAIVMFDIP